MVTILPKGNVSLTFREHSKMISRKYIMPQITVMVTISSWNIVHLPKYLWVHAQSISLKFLWEVRFQQYTNFERIFWRACETLVKEPPEACAVPGQRCDVVASLQSNGSNHIYTTLSLNCMMASSNGSIFRVTGHLCEEFTGHQLVPRTKASDTELWCFLWSAPV